MKVYVLTLSEFFPAGQFMAGFPTDFFKKVESGEKIHTIRANYELWEKRFKNIDAGNACLSLRKWTGKPYQSKQHEVFRYDRSHGIGIQKLTMVSWPEYAKADETIITVDRLADNDGLTNIQFVDWFKKYDYSLQKPLALIHFCGFRY